VVASIHTRSWTSRKRLDALHRMIRSSPIDVVIELPNKLRIWTFRQEELSQKIKPEVVEFVQRGLFDAGSRSAFCKVSHEHLGVRPDTIFPSHTNR
jgi:hypothetical protein